jgi:uncharacterized protein YcbX
VVSQVRIASLHYYPLKSARAIDCEQARLTASGIADDRRWMVVKPDGVFLTQREQPRLALIRIEPGEGTLLLQAPGRAPLQLALKDEGRTVRVRVWQDHCAAIDEGDEAAAWIGALLACDCRLVRFASQQRRLSDAVWTRELEAESQFADAFPLLAIGAASLGDLNRRLARALPMSRFRPNIVLDGLPPYAEDRIHELYDEQLCLRVVKPCTRCVITTTDQEHAVRDGEEPLRTLKTYRYDANLRGVTFGQNLIIVHGLGSVLRCNQPLRVRWKERV